jgi:hypothetical protein
MDAQANCARRHGEMLQCCAMLDHADLARSGTHSKTSSKKSTRNSCTDFCGPRSAENRVGLRGTSIFPPLRVDRKYRHEIRAPILDGWATSAGEFLGLEELRKAGHIRD